MEIRRLEGASESPGDRDVSEHSRLPISEPKIDFAPLGYRGSQEGHTQEGRSIDIVRFAISIWKWLALGLIVGCGLGCLAYLYTGPVYVAETQVMVSKKASAGEQDARVYSDRGGHLNLIKSDAVARIALEKHGLQENFAKDKDPLKSVWENLDVKRINGEESSYDNQLSFSYQSADKEVAKKVVTSVVSAYSDWLDARRETSSHELYQTFLSSKKEMDRELTQLEDDYAAWRESVPFYISSSPAVTAQGIPMAVASPYQEGLKDIGTLQRLNLDLLRKTKIKIDLLKTMMADPEGRESLQAWVLNSIASGGSAGGEGGMGSGLISSPAGKSELDQQLLAARLLEKRLLLVLGENHADVRNVRRQIETIVDFYQRQGLTPPHLGNSNSAAPQSPGKGATDLAQTYLTILESKLDELEDEKLSLTTAYHDAEKTAKSAATYEVVDQRYKDDISRKMKELDAVLKQITEFDMNKKQEGYTLARTNDVRVSRSIKRVIKMVGAFGVLGLMAVFGLAYFREWYDTTLKTAEETRDVIGATVLGAIPHFKNSSRPATELLAQRNGLSPALVYYHRPGSREAEAYRSLRTTLFHSTKHSTDKVIQLTSAEPGDGKSTTAANLAIAIAQSGKKVLLIDADLRRPTMHSLFSLPQDIGLTEVLLNEIAWSNAVRPTSINNLSVLTAGLCPDNPAELLSLSHLPEMLKAARTAYDFIIIDTPPILAISDPAIIAPHIDGLLLVVRMGKNRRAVAERARALIDAHSIRLYGVIVNDVDYSSDLYYNEYDKYFEGDKPGQPRIGGRERVAAGKSSSPLGL